MRRYEITDQQWERIAQVLPGKVGHVDHSATDNHLFINAVLWIARSGAPWRDLPERFGPGTRSINGFGAGPKLMVWKTVFDALQEPDLDWLTIDSTTVRAHQHAAGQKK